MAIGPTSESCHTDKDIFIQIPYKLMELSIEEFGNYHKYAICHKTVPYTWAFHFTTLIRWRQYFYSKY